MKRIATMVAIILALFTPISYAGEYPLPEKDYPSVTNNSSVWMLEVVVIPEGCDSPSSQCLFERTWYIDPGSRITFYMLWNDHFTLRLRGIKYKDAVVGQERHTSGYTWGEELVSSPWEEKLLSLSETPGSRVALTDKDFSTSEEYKGINPWLLPALENKTERWLLGSELYVSGSCGAFYPDDPCTRGHIIYLEPGNRVRYEAPGKGCRLEVNGLVHTFWGVEQRTVYVENFHNAAPNILVSGYYWLFPDQGSVSLDFRDARGPRSFLFR